MNDTEIRTVPVLVRVHTRKDKTHSKFISVKVPLKVDNETKWVNAYFGNPEIEPAVTEAAKHLKLSKENPYGYLGTAEVKGAVILSLQTLRRVADLLRVEDIYTE